MPNLAHMPIRALVVDDHVDVANTSCELLKLLGCKTAAAFGGITGARLAELFKPDIVFMDLGMPDLDGESALQAGFDYFLTKPVEPEVFERLIDQVRHNRGRDHIPAGPAPARAAVRPE